MTDKVNHVHQLRHAIMTTLSLYARVHDDVNDTQMAAALSACLCDALIIKGQPFNEDLIDVIRKTYEVCELQYAMTEKNGETVQ